MPSLAGLGEDDLQALAEFLLVSKGSA